MKGYSELKVFSPRELDALYWAQRYVSRIPSLPEYRCHEVARVIRTLLRRLHGYELGLVDGKCGHVEHSWLVGAYDPPTETTGYLILDVYAVGELPMVKLVAHDAPAAQLYQPRPHADNPERDDIRKDDIREMLEVWNFSLAEERTEVR